MKKSFLFLFFLQVNLYFYSQPLTTPENERSHRRYWYYRARFINDFTKIGGEQGDCIAFAQRNHSDWPVFDMNAAKIGPDQIDIMNQYLSALALEYKILSRSNQSTAETLQ
jgi:hypothetical protein